MSLYEFGVIAASARRTSEDSGTIVFSAPTREECRNWLESHIGCPHESRYYIVKIVDIFDVIKSVQKLDVEFPIDI